MNSKKNILITGGAGFIGSHLCKRLLNDGNKIICLDNLFTGSKDNISGLIDNPDFEFVNHDITKPYYRDGIDQIYNLACPASPIHYQINPIDCIHKTNIIAILTEWDEFKDYDWMNLYKKMSKPAYIFDGRNILDKVKLESIGFNYIGLGR